MQPTKAILNRYTIEYLKEILRSYNSPNMDTRKIKLALTVGLINTDGSLNSLQELMSDITEVGSFLGKTLVNKAALNPSLMRKTYAMKYENCTLAVDLVSNAVTNSQQVHGFQLQ